MEGIKKVNEIAIAKINDRNLPQKVRGQLSHSLENILFKCKFNLQECTHQSFTSKFDKLFGNCFVFNSKQNESDKLKESTISSSIHGLQLEFYVGFHQNLTIFNSQNGIGAIIKIENSSYLMPFADEINVPSGFKTSISIERSFKSNLPIPYSNCDLDNEGNLKNYYNSGLFESISHSDYNYEQQ